MMGYGFGFGGIWMILIVAIIVIAVVMIAKGAGGDRWASPSSGESPRRSALQLLEERYARGELEREEFLQKKRDLEQSDTGKKP